MSLKNIFVAILLAIALSVATLVALRMSAPALPQAALILPSPISLPTFTLQDQYGNAVNADSFRGQWDVVFFGFTNCPDICPATLQILATAKRELMAGGAAQVPRIVLVSVDPERDSPEQLRKYVDHFGEGNLGVTGTLTEIKKLTSAIGIYFDKRPSDDDNYSVDHSAVVVMLNPNGEFHALMSAPHVVANYVHDLPIIMDTIQKLPPLVASEIEITAAIPGMQMNAGYLSLTNNSAEPISISRVISPQFESVEIHESTLDGGVAKMRPLPELVVPARSTITLERGGKHLMLARPFGSVDSVSLKFYSGKTLVLGVSANITARSN